MNSRDQAGTDAWTARAYDFAYPPELIAQEPLARRDESRLLFIARSHSSVSDAMVADLPSLLSPNDLLVFNDTRVIKARLDAKRTDTQGHVELLIVHIADGSATALVRTRGTLTSGARVTFGDPPASWVLGEPLGGGSWRVETGLSESELLACLDRFGRVPVPPYIKRERGEDARDRLDEERYQTLFASRPGAVAAPTAGLHFSSELIAKLEQRGVRRAHVTLHVGPGTFRPVTVEDVRDHQMHSEHFEVSESCVSEIDRARAASSRVVAVGTTVVRALESAFRDGRIEPGCGSTRLFIHPPYEFKTIDALFTNFHAPRSTLLMLTAAFAGRELILRAYEHAIANRYRLFSYGDATLIV
jgi:S-adenosylmethionine:tRNA ribosyltransferase-isomerase